MAAEEPGSQPLEPAIEAALQDVLDGTTKAEAARKHGVSQYRLSRSPCVERLRYLGGVATKYAGIRASKILLDIEYARRQALDREDWQSFAVFSKMLLDRIPAPLEAHPDDRSVEEAPAGILPKGRADTLRLIENFQIQNGAMALPAEIQEAEFTEE